jgi:hypothetical protein
MKSISVIYFEILVTYPDRMGSVKYIVKMKLPVDWNILNS